MKYIPLIWAALWRKPLRTTLTMLALVVAFVLFGLMQGINAGFDLVLESGRMDHLSVNSRFGPSMPMSYKQQILQMPGVKSVVAQEFMGGLINGDPKKRFFVGAAEDGFWDWFAEFHVTPAQKAELRSKRTGFIISQLNADQWGLKVGDHVVMKSQIARKSGGNNWDFDLIAIVDRDDVPKLAGISAGNIEYLDEERATGQGMADQFLVLMNDPSLAVSTARAIDDMYLNSGVPTRTQIEKIQFEQSMTDQNISTMVHYIVAATLFALLLVTGNSMMQSFRERIPELGTLKALGFSDRQVLGLVVGEAVIQCTAGAAVGLVIARATTPYVKKLLTGPSAFMTVSWSLIGLGFLLACLVAIVSSAIPAWRAGRMQIVNALAAR